MLGNSNLINFYPADSGKMLDDDDGGDDDGGDGDDDDDDDESWFMIHDS